MGYSKHSGEINVNGEKILLTNITKPLWEKQNISKIDYLQYLSSMKEYMLPFLRKRTLTTIRYPHGVPGESFYQKNCPEYAPDYIHTHLLDGINYIVCENIETLIWLGNQAAIEFHIPFSFKNSKYPSEIVFDLDPPSRNEFSLAIEASLLIKEAMDKLNLISFVKTSGNKGLQVYIPLRNDTFSYEETRLFTAFIAEFLIQKEPKWFTTERLKEKRENKLYVDYVQHAKGKTIIAPYSLRANEEALVATPLYWDEVKRNLNPTEFPMSEVLNRLKKKGCPFSDYFKVKSNQPLQVVIDNLKKAKV